MLWIAPEILRNHSSREISQAADVFSFAIILYEMCTRCEPYISEPWYISLAGKYIQDLINKAASRDCGLLCVFCWSFKNVL